MSIFVRYDAPVLVEVDLAGGHVLHVQVDDEAVTSPQDVFAIDELPLSDADRRRATEIAQQASWPAWELGR